MKGRKQKETRTSDISVYDLIPRVHITPIILEVEEPPPQTALLERYTVKTAEDTFKGKLASSRDNDELKDIINQ